MSVNRLLGSLLIGVVTAQSRVKCHVAQRRSMRAFEVVCECWVRAGPTVACSGLGRLPNDGSSPEVWTESVLLSSFYQEVTPQSEHASTPCSVGMLTVEGCV